MPEEFKYWAFISYSHQDKAWGDWLHAAAVATKPSTAMQAIVRVIVWRSP